MLDNRGVSNSDSPKGRYTTSDMAIDVEELLEFVGWTDERSLHVVGVSMGGSAYASTALGLTRSDLAAPRARHPGSSCLAQCVLNFATPLTM